VGSNWDPLAAESWIDEFVGTLIEPGPVWQAIYVAPGGKTMVRTPVGPIVVDDVVEDSQSFNKQALLAERDFDRYPCVETTPEPIPIDLTTMEPDAFGGKRATVKQLRSMLRADIGDYPVAEARNFFRRAMRTFVLRRVQGADHGLGSAYLLSGEVATHEHVRAARNTVPFTVHTVSSGLRTYFAPAYLIKLQTVFGDGLSTPVRGELEPARYVFGAGAPGMLPKFDVHAKYDVPPASSAHLPD
jgi:hypothetical protein